MGKARFESQLVRTGAALARHCNAGTEAEALDTLYHSDCVSIEALNGPNGREACGVTAIRAKHEWWNGAFEEHASSTQGPFFHAPDQFTLIFDVDVTERESGQRMQMQEVGLYTVDSDGQIIREQFYFAPMEG